MKRKVLVTLCLCMIGLAGTVTGCGSKKEETPVVEEEKKEPIEIEIMLPIQNIDEKKKKSKKRNFKEN